MAGTAVGGHQLDGVLAVDQVELLREIDGARETPRVGVEGGLRVDLQLLVLARVRLFESEVNLVGQPCRSTSRVGQADCGREVKEGLVGALLLLVRQVADVSGVVPGFALEGFGGGERV